MTRTKLKDRVLPNYSKGNEIFNSVTHMVGAALGIVSIVLCVVFAAIKQSVYGVIGGAIFGASMTVMYTISAIYHLLSPKLTGKKVMQVLDHCTIFFLIAGTYTPVALCSIREYSTWLGWTIFGIVWAAAIVGIVFNSIDLKKYKKFSMICYLAMGWCVIIIIDKIPLIMHPMEFLLILLGGISYTIGAVLYGIGAKRPVMHAVFHIFTVIASLLHFLAILLYTI
ncbi:MAG: hemolysin III family protein [Clostridia bacterium]|nr:hemolysin III family protein [Oscillospiraceae bacterium]MBR4893389.1 hemolysin III family protein [Clostridia bacterium]